MRSWGATQQQLDDLMIYDYTTFKVESVVSQSVSIEWGLSLLTQVALRFAGADGLSPEEEHAILSLYQITGQSEMLYHATKGLEDTRRISLNRLNEIFDAG
jgi:hypothetical protein